MTHAPRRLAVMFAAITVLAGVVVSSSAIAAASSSDLRCDGPGGVGHRTPVLLVHGYDSDASVWSQQTRETLAPNASRTCIATFDYGKYSTQWVTDSHIGPALARAITDLSARSSHDGGTGKVVIVAHSMGGLAVRCAANPSCSGVADVAKDIRALATFATPSLGTWLKGYGRSDLADLLGAYFDATCVNSGADLTVVKGICDQLRAWGTSPAAIAFTPGSSQLTRLPALPKSIPVLALAGSVKIETSFFGRTQTLGDVGDIVVGEDSALAGGNVVDGIGGALVEDCGSIDLSQTVSAFASLECWHESEPNDEGFVTAALGMITTIERHDAVPQAPLPAVTSTQQTAQAVQQALQSAGLSAQVFPGDACAEVDVFGAVPASDAVDLLIAHSGGVGCADLPFATFYEIRSGVADKHAEECDCGSQSASLTALEAPYGTRQPTPFHVDQQGGLVPGVGGESPLTPFVGSWNMHAGNFTIRNDATGSLTFPLEPTGTAPIPPSYPNLSVKATSFAGNSARFVITASDTPSLPVGTSFTVRLAPPGLVVEAGPIPSPWCDQTNFDQGVCGA